MTIQEAIRFNYLFRGLSPEQLEKVAGAAVEANFAGGDVMIRQFDRSSDLMIILNGAAQIKAFSGESMAEVGVGSVVGEVSLIDEQPRSATVISVGDTRVVLLKGAKLQALMDADPILKATLVGNLARLLCQRLRTSNIQLDAALANGSRLDSEMTA